MNKITGEKYIDMVLNAYVDVSKVQVYVMDKTSDGKTVACVVGFKKDMDEEFEYDDDIFRVRVNGEVYGLCYKVGVNVGAMDTYDGWVDLLEAEEMVVPGYYITEDDVNKINETAEELIEGINSGKLRVVTNWYDGYIPEYRFVMERKDGEILDDKKFSRVDELREYYRQVWKEKYDKCLDDEATEDDLFYWVYRDGFLIPIDWQYSFVNGKEGA